jgi:hypothetical protein
MNLKLVRGQIPCLVLDKNNWKKSERVDKSAAASRTTVSTARTNERSATCATCVALGEQTE